MIRENASEYCDAAALNATSVTTRIERLVETVYDFRGNTPNFSRAGGALLIYGMYGMFAAALHQRELMLSMWR